MNISRACMSAALLLAALPAASAAVLIEVNVSDPSAVTFRATGNPAVEDDNSTTMLQGITLLRFLTAPNSIDDPLTVAGNLMPTGAGSAYELFYIDNHSSSYTDLNLYRETPPFPGQNFTTTTAAFGGTATLDLSGFPLPSPGTKGDLLAGYSLSHGSIIGEWTVVPEVSPAVQAGVMGAVLMGWLAWRRSSSGR